MNAETAALTRSWKVGSRTCELTIPQLKPGAVLSAVVEWKPSMPQRLTRVEWQQYEAGRNAAIEEFSRALGIRTAVIDL